MRKFSIFPKKTSKKHQTQPERFQIPAESGYKAVNSAVVRATGRENRQRDIHQNCEQETPPPPHNKKTPLLVGQNRG